jgi:hypothetical protein
MVYLFSTLFFVFGIYIGIRIALYIGGKLVEQGQAVFRADGKWQGEDEAFQSIRGMYIK